MKAQEKDKIIFCQKPSDLYLKLLEECGDDPRSAAGVEAMRASESNGGGWVPTIDARDRRVTTPGM